MRIKKKARRVITLIIISIIMLIGIVKFAKMYYNSIEVKNFEKNIITTLGNEFSKLDMSFDSIKVAYPNLTINELHDLNISENKSVINSQANIVNVPCTAIYYIKDEKVSRIKYIITEKSRYEVLNILKDVLGNEYIIDVINEELANKFNWKYKEYNIEFVDNVENIIITIKKI